MTPTRERASLQASVYNTLGNLHNNAGHWHDAIAAYQGHLAICQEAGYRCRSGISYDNLGQVYEQMGEATFDQAAEAYQAALRIHQECQDPYLEALAWLSWAGLTQAQGQRQQALAHYLHAIDQIRSAAIGHLDRRSARRLFRHSRQCVRTRYPASYGIGRCGPGI